MAPGVGLVPPICLLCLSLGGGTAAAQRDCDGRSTTPPGISEIDQYTETVPGSCGEERVAPAGGEGDGGAVPPATREELDGLGPAGDATAALAEATTPPGADGDDRGGEAVAPNASDGGSSLPAIVDALAGDGGGMGLLLPLILGGTAILAAAYALRRRRAR